MRGGARRTAAAVVLAAALGSGCGDDGSSEPDGSAGHAPSGCAPGEVATEPEGCQPAGVPSCAEGFELDSAQGCRAILPAQPCDPGQMAIVGETECRPVAPCGDGPWGDIPVDDQTVFVDGSYDAGDSDGTAQRPWPTIVQALAMVPPGGLIAIAEGSYTESVEIVGQHVQLWGRCPERVHWTGASGAPEAIYFRQSQGEVRGVAISGPAIGVFASGSDVTLDRVWIHDTSAWAVGAQNDAGPTSLTVTDSLLEGSGVTAVFVGGAVGLVERTVIRDTQPGASANGFAVAVQENPYNLERGSVTIRSSVLERNLGAEILSVGSDVIIQSSLLRDTRPRAPDQSFGRGVSLQEGNSSGQPSTATIEGSVIENVRDSAVFAEGSTLSMTASVIRGVHATETSPQDGRGVALGPGGVTQSSSEGTIQSALIDGPAGVGVVLLGSHAAIVSTIVRDVQPRPVDGALGRGIHTQPGFQLEPSSLSLRGSIIERAHEVGVVILSGDADVTDTLITDTRFRSSDGLFGDGILIQQETSDVVVALDHVAVAGNARVGLGSYGARVTLLSSAFECNPIQLDGEPFLDLAPIIEDRGGNVCACAGQQESCIMQSTGIAPPDPLPE